MHLGFNGATVNLFGQRSGGLPRPEIKGRDVRRQRGLLGCRVYQTAFIPGAVFREAESDHQGAEILSAETYGNQIFGFVLAVSDQKLSVIS